MWPVFFTKDVIFLEYDRAMEECSCHGRKVRKMVAALGIPIILCVYNSFRPPTLLLMLK